MHSALDIYIGTRSVACLGGGAGVGAGDSAGVAGGAGWHAQVNGLDEALEALAARLGAKRRLLRPPVRLWLSGGLCRPCLLEPPMGLAGEAEFERVAVAMAPARTGLTGPCRVWFEPALATTTSTLPGPRLVVAVSQVVLDQCLAVLRGARLRPVSVKPWWAGVLNAALSTVAMTPAAAAKVEMLGVRDCDSLTVLAGAADSFEHASSLSPLVDEASAEAAWRRASATLSAAPGRVLRVQFSTSQRTWAGALPNASPLPWAQGLS